MYTTIYYYYHYYYYHYYYYCCYCYCCYYYYTVLLQCSYYLSHPTGRFRAASLRAILFQISRDLCALLFVYMYIQSTAQETYL